MSGATIRVRFARARTKQPWVAPEVAAPPLVRAPTRLARMLALAHCIERMVEAGELSGYAEAARALGVTRARMTQVMNLLLLAPGIQEAITMGDNALSERGLRCVKREAGWQEQMDRFERSTS